eukprot:Skav206706  [mRNA]  locus=scaffold99:189541:195269:+ [translate_table: standard]
MAIRLTAPGAVSDVHGNGHGSSRRSVTELYMQGVRAVGKLGMWTAVVLAPEPYIPQVLPLKCAALRRLASACMLLAGLLMLAALSSFDLLQPGDHNGTGSYIAFLSALTFGQFLQRLILMLFQLVIAASAQMRYEEPWGPTGAKRRE